LTQGWRAEVCGDLLTDVLDGRIALRVNDPKAEYPLVFERHHSPGKK
jgi:ribonuclease D